MIQNYEIPAPTKTLIHRLSEIGYLYIRVRRYTKDCEGRSGVGMIEQSLCHHLQTQLTEYYKLIAVLESQMSIVGHPDQMESSHKEDKVVDVDDDKEEETGLTLRRLDVWINEWRLRMRMMSVCVEGARGTFMYLSFYLSLTNARRCPWRCSCKSDPWIYRQRGSLRPAVH
jgi:gamma-tubulin complex component 3